MNADGWVTLGRALADALMKMAHERGVEEKRRVAELQTELCSERRAELEQIAGTLLSNLPDDPKVTIDS